MSENSIPSLEESREKIDRIDREMVRLFCERMQVAADVAAYKRAVGKPDRVRAVMAAQQPGTEVTVTPAAAHSATRSSPGSLIAGVPASLTSAQDSPPCKRSTMRGPRSFLLCS